MYFEKFWYDFVNNYFKFIVVNNSCFFIFVFFVNLFFDFSNFRVVFVNFFVIFKFEICVNLCSDICKFRVCINCNDNWMV